MNNKFVKIFSVILSLVLIISCFAGCKKQDSGIPEKPTVEKPVDNQDDDSIFTDDDDIFSEENSEKETTETTSEDITENKTEKPSKNPTTTNISSEIITNQETTTKPNKKPTLDIVNLVKIAGFDYDESQQVFYSVINPLQRHFGFSPIYDAAASSVTMKYKTMKIDFNYNDLLWRIQCWKGQYGVLIGGEMGVYTKDPNSPNDGFYECADNDHLMEMQFRFYDTYTDFVNRQMTFERKLQEHWWLTGFQFGYCDSKECVLEMILVAYDEEMANGIESGLKRVKDDTGMTNGFVEYSKRTKWDRDFYLRDGNKFTIVWCYAGFDNYEEKK